jgi:hypothetical protein
LAQRHQLDRCVGMGGLGKVVFACPRLAFRIADCASPPFLGPSSLPSGGVGVVGPICCTSLCPACWSLVRQWGLEGGESLLVRTAWRPRVPPSFAARFLLTRLSTLWARCGGLVPAFGDQLAWARLVRACEFTERKSLATN